MATLINTQCKQCGDVRVTADDVSLKVCDNKPSCSFLSFICPECLVTVRIPADKKVITLLMGAGVQPILWRVPAEVLEEKAGPPLTFDDVIDFGIALYMSDTHPLDNM